ncbi:MAG: fasciclin domain-containing protein [Culturomica sp.]|jgi:uncharacterized surface protein with fasciclin (FAS1) repeats|nr:fasciclin domain-containing protein [Culturomica sp.]
MNRKYVLKLCTAILIVLLAGCREEFDDHYNSGDGSMGMSVTQLLESRGEHELFVAMIRRAQLEKTLNESGLYTCLAPRDEHVQSWLTEKGWTVADMPERELIKYVNYHFLVDKWYLYDFEKKYEHFDNTWRYNIAYSQQVTFSTRGDDKNPGKYIRIFTEPYFRARNYDYVYLRGGDGAGFVVENVPVSLTERDIPMSNGVLHVLDGPLNPAPRIDEALAADPEFSILNSWLDEFYNYESRGMDPLTGYIDTTQTKYYNISTAAIGKVSDIADETRLFVMFAPTDQSIRAQLEPYMNPDQLVHYDSIPRSLKVDILRSFLKEEVANRCWGISDIVRNNPYLIMDNSSVFPIGNDITTMNPRGILSSNGVIYKVDKMPEIPTLQSVEAGLYINYKKYRFWERMIQDGWLFPGATDKQSYQHPPRTILIQPDASVTAWTNPDNSQYGIDAWPANYQDTLGGRLRAGILNFNVPDGEFEHRFYPAPHGYILYEDGFFYDWKGKQTVDPSRPVQLLSTEATWEGVNGSIYEIDGIFELLLATDTNRVIYRTYIKNKPQLSHFNTLLEKAGMTKMLDVTLSVYTVFIPTNSAFEAGGYSADQIQQMSPAAARRLVEFHIAPQSRVFTDGRVSAVMSLGGLPIRFSGSWDSFRMITIRDRNIAVVNDPAQTNLQASNGVVQIINGVLDDR